MRTRTLPVALAFGAAIIVTVAVACSASSGTATPSPSATDTAAPAAATGAPGTASAGASPLRLTSPAFVEGAAIPEQYSCDGDDTSPPLAVAGVPRGTAALALIVDDPDAPSGTWTHWVAYDFPPVATIPAGVDALGTDGTNSWGDAGYGGPCPPNGMHHYRFHLWALDAPLRLAAGADAGAVRDALDGHVLAEATLTGTFSR